MGVETAKTLAWAWGKPLIPVCHLEGHIYASWLTDSDVPAFPALALIVSGGHTELVLMKDHGVFERLGETRDDAAGEAFDKVGKMLGLAYPGGPRVEELARTGNVDAFVFPRAMRGRDDFEFSFSGLKTAVLYTLREHEARLHDDAFRSDVAASFQQAVIDVLVGKTALAVERYHPASVVLAGGVAANRELRRQLGEACAALGLPLCVPAFTFSVDNAAMIAVAGYFRARQGNSVDPFRLVAQPNMDIA